MGIGLVDPILQPIAEKLHASPSQVSLLFTSYMAVTGIAMLVTGVISSRIGSKRTMQGGLALIVVFSALAGSSNTIGQIVGFRAGWGLGNALFIATALATIVGAASRGVGEAIICDRHLRECAERACSPPAPADLPGQLGALLE